jgi:hypothetical protein
MAEEKKPKIVFEKIASPRGVAVWPRLTEPDFKFKKELGEYSVKLRVPKDVAEAWAGPLVAALDKLVAEQKAEMEAELKEAKGKKKADLKKALDEMPINPLPITPAYDDEGNETDEMEIKFAASGGWKDKKTGAIKPRKIPLEDSKGNPIKRKLDIWGGSEIRVFATIRPYVTPKGIGVRLGLEAVRIIKLVQGGAGGFSAAAYGVEKEDDLDDDAFDADSLVEDNAAPSADASEENPDF